MDLSKVRPGKTVKIISFHQDLEDENILTGFGIIPGDTIEVLAKSLFGSPISLKVGEQSFVALRKSHAQYIEVDFL